MKCRPPQPWQNLSPAQRQAIVNHARNVAKEQSDRDGRLMLDSYIKMVCVVLHDAFGFGEKRLNLFLANHVRLFHTQHTMVKEGTQLEYLERRMAEIFRKDGFPQQMFDRMLGPVEKETPE